MMELIEGETLTVLRKGIADWAGDGANEFSFSHTIDDVIVEHENMSAEKMGRDDFVVNGHIYLPLGSDILATDRVERANGDLLQIRGKPYEYDYGLASGVAVKFREVNGGGS